MRKRNVRAAIAAALCMTVLAAGCGKKADDPVFTGDNVGIILYFFKKLRSLFIFYIR